MQGGRSCLANLGLRPGEWVDFVVRGECMRGLDDGSSLRVQRRRVYFPGDVVVVRQRDHWNAHRFLGYVPTLRGVLALTAADDSDERDPAAPASAVVGRANTGVTPLDRYHAFRKYAAALLRRATEVLA